jgi:hypothetical protein
MIEFVDFDNRAAVFKGICAADPIPHFGAIP